ncbi:MAG: penicillin acylase family protein [Planctomycetota bacterium]
MATTVTITRDAFGVPHIEAETDAGAVFGFVYARAEDEFHYVEQSIIASLGRLSEVRGEQGVLWDRLLHSLDVQTIAKQDYESASPRVRALCDAGADALNWFLHNRPDVEPALLTHFEPWWFCAQDLGFSVNAAVRELQRAGTANPSGFPADVSRLDGSNAWAIAPSRTPGRNGPAMLFINPHIPLEAVYEGHLTSDEGWNIYGATAYGRGLMPMFGHNQRLGWALTVNQPDIVDFYRITFGHDTNPLAYRYDAGWRQGVERFALIRVLQDDGTLEERQLRFIDTHHGPIIRQAGGDYLALRVAGLDSGGALAQWYAMSKAQTLDQFKAAIAKRALSFHNVVYADADGNIFYVYNGSIPRRSNEFDWSKPVNGSDPNTEWDGYYEVDDLPQILNPRSGYVQNCNSDPFLTTSKDNPGRADFPSAMIGPDPINFRMQRSHAILGQGEPLTFDSLSEATFDTYVHASDSYIPRIVKGWEALLKSDPDRAEQLRDSVDLLVTWDRKAAVDSEATTVFMLWFEAVYPAIQSDTLTDAMGISALESIVQAIERTFGRRAISWGEVNRHQRPADDPANPFSDDRPSLPVAGGHGEAGIMFNFIARAQNTRLRYGFHGNSYVSIVAFGDSPRARSLTPYGQSRDPESPHFEDQMSLYAQGRLRDVFFTRDAFRANAKQTYRPGE